jgi:hypothetical protein
MKPKTIGYYNNSQYRIMKKLLQIARSRDNFDFYLRWI